MSQGIEPPQGAKVLAAALPRMQKKNTPSAIRVCGSLFVTRMFLWEWVQECVGGWVVGIIAASSRNHQRPMYPQYNTCTIAHSHNALRVLALHRGHLPRWLAVHLAGC